MPNPLRMGTVLATAGLALVGAATARAQQPNISIAVVDLEQVIAQSQSGKELQARLEKFQQDFQAEAEKRAESARELRQRISQGANTLSDDKLAELQKQFEDASIDMRRFRDDKEREGQKIQQEALRQIERQLQPVFEKIRDERGYDLILNNVPGVVVMANDKVDITALVIERFNASLAAGGGGEASGGAEG